MEAARRGLKRYPCKAFEGWRKAVFCLGRRHPKWMSTIEKGVKAGRWITRRRRTAGVAKNFLLCWKKSTFFLFLNQTFEIKTYFLNSLYWTRSWKLRSQVHHLGRPGESSRVVKTRNHPKMPGSENSCANSTCSIKYTEILGVYYINFKYYKLIYTLIIRLNNISNEIYKNRKIFH